MTRKLFIKVFLATLFFAVPYSILAAPVTQGQARAIAQAFMKQKGITAKPGMTYRAPRRQAANSYYYVFNAGDDKGFVIVSGDDRTPQILGYSDTGSLDMSVLPENIKSFLQSYADGIKHLDDENISEVQAKPVLKAKEGTTHPVSPLLTCTWNQGSPYNNYCPSINDTMTVTGCVATAMAQVMYYYKWPEKTKATIPSYTTSTRKIAMNSVEAGTSIFWDNMTDSYTSSQTDSHAAAVANLMSYVGRSVNMNYNFSSNGGSGASSSKIAPALRNYFDYSCYDIDRSDYTLSEFESIIYNEIADSRPVIFGGFSTGGGHEFVIDGYDGNGLFHVNWGWGGSSNGYFLISVLNPHDNSGIGASTTTDGYSISQSAVIGIKKGAESKQDDAVLGLTAKNFSIDNDNAQVTVSLWNWTNDEHVFEYGLAEINKDGSVKGFIRDSVTTASLGVTYGYRGLTMDFQGIGLSIGTHLVAVASRVKGTTKLTYSPYTLISVTVANDYRATATLAASAQNLSVSNWVFTGSKTAGVEQLVNITISNSGGGEYYGTVSLYTSKDNTDTEQCKTGLTVKANDTTTSQMSFTVSSAGTYSIWLKCYDQAQNKYVDLEKQTVEIGEASSSSTANLSMDSYKIDNYDNGTAYGKTISGNVVVKNNSDAAFNGSLIIYLFKSGESHNVDSSEPSVNIAAGSTATVPFSFSGWTAGQYSLAVNYYSTNTRITNGNDIPWFSLADGIVTYNPDGSSTAKAASSTVTVDDYSTAIDLSAVENTVTSVTANSNPNTLYYFSTKTSAAQALEDAGKNVIIDGTADKLTLTDNNNFNAPIAFTAKEATYTRKPSIGTDGTGNGWQTICLPFDVTSVTAEDFANPLTWFTSAEDKGKDFWLMDFAELDGSTVVFGFNSTSTLAANTPYIIAVPGDKWGEKYSLIGKTLTFSGENVSIGVTKDNPIIAGSSAYNFVGTTVSGSLASVYGINSDGTAFVQETHSPYRTGVSPFTAYFVKKENTSSDVMASLNIAIEGSGTTTGIGDVKSEEGRLLSTDKMQKNQNAPVYNLAGQRVDKDYKGIVIKNGKKIINR